MSDPPAGDRARPGPGPAGGFERLGFFSDAVFAIAITLLAVDVRLPEVAPAAALGLLARLFVAAVPLGQMCFRFPARLSGAGR